MFRLAAFLLFMLIQSFFVSADILSGSNPLSMTIGLNAWSQLQKSSLSLDSIDHRNATVSIAHPGCVIESMDGDLVAAVKQADQTGTSCILVFHGAVSVSEDIVVHNHQLMGRIDRPYQWVQP